LYADADATGDNNGASWADAYSDLQDALAAGTVGSEIRVAQGVYTPAAPGGDRAAGFRVLDGVVLYVDDDAPDDPGHGTPEVSDPLEDGTEAHPFDAIQEAIDAASGGDTVIVLDGTYTGQGNRDVDFGGRAITVRSANGPENCIIDSQGTEQENHRGFYFHSGEDRTSVVSGFTITGGHISGAYVPSGWDDASGGGIFCDNQSAPTIRNNKIIGNTALRGGGVFCEFKCPAAIVNNVIAQNTADRGGGIYVDEDAEVEITNNTIAGNRADHLGGGIYNFKSRVAITNCILWGNGDDLYNCTATYSCVQDGSEGTGNTSVYPYFVDAEAGDYHLRSYSPCINAGDHSAVSPDALDIDGQDRILLGDVDMGADEATVVSPDTDTDRLPDDWENEHFDGISATPNSDPDRDELPNLEEYYGGTDPNVDRSTVYVSIAHAGDPLADGTRAHPFSSVQRGVDVSTGRVLVVAGVYAERVLVDGKELSIEGGYGADFGQRNPAEHTTTLDAQQSGRTVTYFGTPGGSLSGMTITGGHAFSGAGVFCMESAPTITGNTITGNRADDQGGGITCDVDSPATIADNQITDNTSPLGGGVYTYRCAPVIIGNTIAGNAATGNRGRGGGVFCGWGSSPLIADNRITENSAWQGGGVICYSISSPTLTGNTVTNNIASVDGGGIACLSSDAVVNGNTIADNRAENGGGVYLLGDDYVVEMSGNLIAGNTAVRGGGVAGWSPVTFTNNTVSGNAAEMGGGLHCRNNGGVVMTNCILHGNTASTGREIAVDSHWQSGSLTVGYSNVAGGQAGVHVEPGCTLDWGEGNIDDDPRFANAAGGNYRLRANSPSIDAADNMAVPQSVVGDLDGHPRFVDDPNTPDTGHGMPPIVDMGAYERADPVVLHVPGQTEFDGHGDYLEFEDSPDLNINEYSIAFWFRADSPDDGTQALLARGEDWARDKAQWVIELNDWKNRGKLQLWYEEANDKDHYFATETTIEAATWYHFAVTRSSAGEVTVYLDGRPELHVTEPHEPASVETPITLGARRNTPSRVQDYFDGTIRETLVYDTVLDGAEITHVMDQTGPDFWSSGQIDVSALGWGADVAMHSDGSFVVVWHQDHEGPGIYARRFDAAGGELGEAIFVNEGLHGARPYASVAVGPDGSFTVVWEDTFAAGGPDVLARRFDADGDPLGDTFVVSRATEGDQMRPDIAADADGNFAVVWGGEDILVQRFDAGGERIGSEILVNAEPQEYPGNPEIAMNASGEFVVSYLPTQYNDAEWVSYDAAGRRLGSGRTDSNYATGLGLNDDGFLVFAWIRYDEGLFAQVHTLGGVAVGDPILVTTGRHGGRDWNIYDCDVTVEDSSFLITWDDYDFLPDDGVWHQGVLAARFDLGGSPLGETISVGASETYDLHPAADSAGDGRSVVAWQHMWGEGILAMAFQWKPAGPAELPDPLLHLPDRMEFDGAGDYLSIDDPALDISSYSIAFWFQGDDPFGPIQSLVARGEDFANDKAQWIVQLNAEENPRHMQLWYEDTGGRDSVFATASEIAADNWYHFAVTRAAGGEVRVYLDGVLELVQTDPSVPASIDSPVYIGARGNSGDRIQEFFDGRMEEVAVFGEVLSAWELNRLRMDTAPDTGFRGLVYHNPDAIELDGAGDYLLIDDSDLLNTNEYTIAFSFLADTPMGGTQSLVARGEDFAGDKAQWVIELNDRRNRGKLQLWYEEEDDADHYFAAEPTIRPDKWYHAVISRSATGRVAIYLDGALRHESIDIAAPASVDTPILIGARRNDTPHTVQDYFDGTIGDVRIYNVAMSHDEIIDIVPPPRLSIDSPVDGETFSSTEIDLDVSFDRPLTDVSYSLNGGAVRTMMPPNIVVREDPDAVDVWSGSVARVTLDYVKPDWAVGAEWAVTYEDASGVHTAVCDLPGWDTLADRISQRVYYRSDDTVTLEAWGDGGWYVLDNLGHNNPGGNGDDVAALYDGNYSTGAAYHRGARRWLTGGLAGSYVKFIEESVRWNIGLAEDAVSGTITAEQGHNTLTVHGTDTLGKTARRTVTFTVDEAAVTNGDFETGSLGPWVLTDSGAVVTGDLFDPDIPPAGGTCMGYITTGRNELPSDLHFTDLDGNGVAEREYSALAIEIFTASAATVEVDLNFLTAEIMPDGTVGASDLFGVTAGAIVDTAAYKLLFAVAPTDGSYSGTAVPLTAVDFSDEFIQDNPFGSYPTIFDTSVFHGQTGFHRYAFALEAGAHTLTFFVADSFTDGEATAMLIDNLRVTL